MQTMVTIITQSGFPLYFILLTTLVFWKKQIKFVDRLVQAAKVPAAIHIQKIELAQQPILQINYSYNNTLISEITLHFLKRQIPLISTIRSLALS